MSVGANKQIISYFGHIYEGQRKDGYAVCSHCGAIENSDEAAILCSRLETPRIKQLKAKLKLLAKLASDRPEFFNPAQAMKAKALRDKILKEK